MRYKKISPVVDKLEHLCLNVIVLNMRIFYSEFRCNSTKIPKFHFEFLQRAYSERLYRLLRKKFLFQNEYIDFLVNPYWKEVKLNICCSRILRSITKKLYSFGGVITSLNISRSLASEDILLAIICCVPNVSSLVLSETGCTDKVLKCMRSLCHSLINLDISFCYNVTNKGLRSLCLGERDDGKFNLESLNVRDTRVSKKGISLMLIEFPMLKYLRYEHLSHILYKMHRRDLLNKTLNKVRKYNLVNFEFEHYEHLQLRPVLEVWSELCPNVKVVKIHGLKTNYELQLCSKFKNLEQILITPHAPNPYFEYMNKFLMLKSNTLTELHLYAVSISVKILAIHCHKLRRLVLNAITFEEFDEKDIDPKMHKLSKLEEIVIYHGFLNEQPTMKSICMLVSISDNLEKLSLCYMRSFWDDVANMILQSSASLSKFDISFSDIKMPVLMKLFSSSNKLNEIAIDMCPNVSMADYARLERAFLKNGYNWRRDTTNDEINCDSDDSDTESCIGSKGLYYFL